MSTVTDIQNARVLARSAHAGQLDKAGKPYIQHVERVANTAGRFIDLTLQEQTQVYIMGLLHDVVEDTDVTLEHIGQQFGFAIRDAVDAITHRENEPWSEYIVRVNDNYLARIVKRADLRDNANIDRALTLAESDPFAFRRVVDVLIPRYIHALEFLGEEDE